MDQGVRLFADQLLALGYETTIDGDWVVFEYVVPGGKYQEAKITMGILVPPNFPNTTPHGIDFSPRFQDRPVNTGAQHPSRSHPSGRWKEQGEHWSRPHPNWNGEAKKAAAAYMAWVTELWMTT